MYHLLFVDDDLDTAREYAEQVANFTNLRPYVCSTKAEALEAVQKYPIAVAVLDQKMPEISGTQLFAELRKIAPRMRAIMLSGEADQTEIGEAMNLGYQKYLHKSDFRKLPQLVLKEFSRYQTEAARSLEFERVYLFKVANFFGLRGTIEFWLEAIFVEDEAFVPNDSWVLIDQVNCGEKKTITERYEVRKELRFEDSLESELSSNIEVGMKATVEIKSKLGFVLKNKIHSTKIVKENKTKETVREITLPQEPSDPNELFVRSRAYYWAPVFRKIQCHILKIIEPMGERVSVALNVLQPTGQIATRQIDFLNDGNSKVIDTHVHRL